MMLIERDALMASLEQHFENIAAGEGHCILISGEAGIGKTALVKAFCKKQQNDCLIYQGACDALFTPRPLAPLYDILWQVNKERWPAPPTHDERSVLFSDVFQELRAKSGRILIVFEDIHWADEGTLDFIKFFARRIYQLPCLFILTYRDNEIFSRHPLRNVLGQLPADSFTKLVVMPLSKEAVVEMAAKKNFNGDDVYSIAGGNPFYVNEILARYSPGVPDNIKDSVLAVFERQEEGTKKIWEIFSVIPEGLEVDRFAVLKRSSNEAVDHCFAINVLMVQKDKVIFKHELYRRTIEESLTPFRQVEINKFLLDLFLDSFEENGEIERILHYSKHANARELVIRYSLLAADKAIATGAHTEAAKLLRTAIEYFDGNDAPRLASLFESYSHECYLSNQVDPAIAFTEKALAIRKQQAEPRNIVNNLRLLSQLWWFAGNGMNAAQCAHEAIDASESCADLQVKAWALSNLSQIEMFSGKLQDSIARCEQALKLASDQGNSEIRAHALNSLGTISMLSTGMLDKGRSMLQQSLEIAVSSGFHEQAARAYANLGSCLVRLKIYDEAIPVIEKGIRHCEERGFGIWTAYILSWQSRLRLETGRWKEAFDTADDLIKYQLQPSVTKIIAFTVLSKLMMRKGIEDPRALLLKAKSKAFGTNDLQIILPVTMAMLEYEWLTGNEIISKNEIEQISALPRELVTMAEQKDLAFWMKKTKRGISSLKQPGDMNDASTADEGTAGLQPTSKSQPVCSYEHALRLFEGNDDDKRNAIMILQEIEADATFEKLKQEMKSQGIRNIPRGIRNSTRSNAAFLTERELEILQLLKEKLQNKEIAAKLYISAKTVDHHISSILFKLDTDSRFKAVEEAVRKGILK